jgi:hypothetical protein
MSSLLETCLQSSTAHMLFGQIRRNWARAGEGQEVHHCHASDMVTVPSGVFVERIVQLFKKMGRRTAVAWKVLITVQNCILVY